MNEQLVTETEFGESTFGKRLNYDRPQYRDPIFAVLYVLHVIAVIGFTGYIWGSEYQKVSSNSSYSPSGSTTVSWSNELNGIIVSLILSVVVSVIMGFAWLAVLKKYAGTVIKFMLLVVIGMWVVNAIAGLILQSMAMFAVGAILALFHALYAWCIWGRIPFASALLGISSTIVSTYQGTVVLSFSVVIFNILWCFLSTFCMFGYFITSEKTVYDEYGYAHVTGPNTFIVILLVISFYWGLQVNRNVSHTTTCGVSATWYFTAVMDHKPTPAAFKRTMTTSFGSVCLGSLIVALLQTARAFMRQAKRGKNPCFALCAYCLLACIESLIRYFNKYAFAQCAIYGTSFVESAKATWNLLSTKGILAIINDDLSGMAIVCGCIVCALVAAAVAAGGIAIFYGDANLTEGDYYQMMACVAVAAAIIGFFLCRIILQVVLSAVVCLFVCFAEDPLAMKQNHEVEYDRVVNAKPEWGQIYQFALEPRAPVVAGNNPPPTTA